jgi:hypothetical protein
MVKLTGATVAQKLPLDGLDIWPVLTAGAKSPHDALILCGTKRGQAAIRMGDWKLLVGAGDGDQLYNLAEDIGEKNNLAAGKPDKLKELRARYDAMMDHVHQAPEELGLSCGFSPSWGSALPGPGSSGGSEVPRPSPASLILTTSRFWPNPYSGPVDRPHEPLPLPLAN